MNIGYARVSALDQISLLVIPGSQLESIPKAKAAGVRNIFIDLEDSVPIEEKNKSREQVLDYFKSINPSNDFTCGLRINSLRSEEGLRDILGIMDAKICPDFIIYPKTEFAAEIIILNELFQSKMTFIALIETALGVANSTQIALASTNIKALACGGGDLARDLGVISSWESMYSSRMAIIQAAAIAKVAAIDMLFVGSTTNNQADIIAETKRARQLGFVSKFALNIEEAIAIDTAFKQI